MRGGYTCIVAAKGGSDKSEKFRPGGTRGGRMLRFAEADTVSAICIRNTAFVDLSNTALARKGLAVFKRYAHSAGPD